MKSIGEHGLVFGTEEEIKTNYPDSRGWRDDQPGYIGPALILTDGTECISLYIGCGREVIISKDGVYIMDNTTSQQHLIKEYVGTAWLPNELYKKASNIK